MRQKHNKPTLASPFVLPTAYKLVDNALKKRVKTIENNDKYKFYETNALRVVLMMHESYNRRNDMLDKYGDNNTT